MIYLSVILVTMTSYLVVGYAIATFCKKLLVKQHNYILFIENQLHNHKLEISQLYTRQQDAACDTNMMIEELSDCHETIYNLSERLDCKPQRFLQ